MKTKNLTRNLVLSALFLAMAYVLPFATGQIQQIGKMLCPMHLPVLICGFVCGWQWGLAVGFVAPLLRSLTLHMPPVFPSAIAMAFELAAYGAMTGIMYKYLPKKNYCIYIALIIAMVAGRFIWGAARFVLAFFDAKKFGLAAFWAGAVTSAIPGIILQIAVVPPIIMSVNKFMRK